MNLSTGWIGFLSADNHNMSVRSRRLVKWHSSVPGLCNCRAASKTFLQIFDIQLNEFSSDYFDCFTEFYEWKLRVSSKLTKQRLLGILEQYF